MKNELCLKIAENALRRIYVQRSVPIQLNFGKFCQQIGNYPTPPSSNAPSQHPDEGDQRGAARRVERPVGLPVAVLQLGCKKRRPDIIFVRCTAKC